MESRANRAGEPEFHLTKTRATLCALFCQLLNYWLNSPSKDNGAGYAPFIYTCAEYYAKLDLSSRRFEMTPPSRTCPRKMPVAELECCVHLGTESLICISLACAASLLRERLFQAANIQLRQQTRPCVVNAKSRKSAVTAVVCAVRCPLLTFGLPFIGEHTRESPLIAAMIAVDDSTARLCGAKRHVCGASKLKSYPRTGVTQD